METRASGRDVAACMSICTAQSTKKELDLVLCATRLRKGPSIHLCAELLYLWEFPLRVDVEILT